MTGCGALLLLVLASCGQEAERKLADVRAELAKVRAELADYKASKQGEIDGLKAQLAQKTKELAEAEKARVDGAAELAAATQAKLAALQEELTVKAQEAASAMKQAADLTKARDALKAELKDVRNALGSQADKIDSLTAELAKLKKFLGR
jgi:predicted  nucleic acid-binding Zn-ribbon protein